MEKVDFCQRNIRGWLALLGALAVSVFAFGVWSGFSKTPAAQAGARLSSTPGVVPVAMSAAYPVAPGLYSPFPQGLLSIPTPVAAAPPPTPSANASPNLSTAFRTAADFVRPSVVNINAVRPGPAPRQPENATNLQFIDPFDGIPDKVIGQQVFENVGSGVIVDSTGYVVTNNHIIQGATVIVVSRFNHEENLPAEVVAADASSDLALLKVSGATSFAPATFTDSTKLGVGEWVMAVGNPFGLGHTVTSGIVSSTQRSLTIENVSYTNLIQTDASINPGSSGGALVNLKGQVVGIPTAIYAPTGVSSGTGFAIPANRVTAFVARSLGARITVQVAAAPLPVQPTTGPGLWLGLTGNDLTADSAARLASASYGGVLVTSVTDDSPASKADVKTDDIITALAGQLVANTSSLAEILGRLMPGQEVALMVVRHGLPEKLTISPVYRLQ